MVGNRLIQPVKRFDDVDTMSSRLGAKVYVDLERPLVTFTPHRCATNKLNQRYSRAQFYFNVGVRGGE